MMRKKNRIRIFKPSGRGIPQNAVEAGCTEVRREGRVSTSMPPKSHVVEQHPFAEHPDCAPCIGLRMPVAGIVLISRSPNFRLFLPSCFRQSPPNAARRTVRSKVSTFIHYTGFWTCPITSPIKQIGSLSSYSNSQSAVNEENRSLIN